MSSNIIGRSLPRLDGLDKVLGRAVYIDDMDFPRMLHAKLLRSRYAHARILSVDTSRAEALSGVKGVIVSRDVPVNSTGIAFKDQPILAGDRVRYLGDPVAAVAAESIEIAEEALDLIEVQYESLPAVFDAREAMKPEAPRLHDKPNLSFHRKIRFGDVEKGFRESDLIVEDEFSTQRQEQCHIEPQGAVAEVDASGRVTVWTSTQRLPLIHSELMRVLALPASLLRVIQTTLGGGFGGKTDLSVEPYVALLAMKTRRPVKMIWTREDEFIGSTIRHNYFIKYKTGVKRDGRMMAREVELVADTGAYTSYGDIQLTKASIFARGPYNIPNAKVDAYLVHTNNPVAGAMRGFGVLQVTAAEESHTDNIVERLEMDALEFRLKNALKTGDQLATGQVLHSVGLMKTLMKAGETAGWGAPLPQAGGPSKRVGRGVACFQYPIGFTARPNPSGAFLKVNNDGTVNVIPGALEIGQGGHTVLAQIVAEEMGISPNHITVITGDTDIAPFDFGTVASRTTYTAGNAVRLAASTAKETLFKIVAEKLSVSPEALDARDSVIFVKSAPQKSISIAEAAMTAQVLEGKPILTSATFNPPNTPLDPETGRGNPFPCYVYGTQVADVEVDVETGQVKVLRVVAAHDVGKAINPVLVEGQIAGGVVMGLGQALMEDLMVSEGRTLNPNFMDYIIPTTVDVPEIDLILVEENEPTGPFGAKGVAEPPNIPTAPAILNAIYNATGIRLTSLPATPEKILNALKK